MNKFYQFRKEFKKGSAKEIYEPNGIAVDYSIESLMKLERIFKNHRSQDEKTINHEIFLLGFYLGETLCENIKGAKWNADEAEVLWDIEVRIPTGKYDVMTLYPFRRAHKFYVNGEHSLSGYYEATKELVTKKIDPRWMPNQMVLQTNENRILIETFPLDQQNENQENYTEGK